MLLGHLVELLWTSDGTVMPCQDLTLTTLIRYKALCLETDFYVIIIFIVSCTD
jgi:hypothetical protein